MDAFPARPVRANHLFSMPVPSDCQVRCTSIPGQPYTSEGVTDLIALACAGGVEESFFTGQRSLPAPAFEFGFLR